MNAEQLAAKLREQREHWVDVGGGKRVKLRRPHTVDLAKFKDGITIELITACVVGWGGFTEADLLGPAIGASDPAPFSADLWSEVVRDRVDLVPPIVDALVRIVSEHVAATGKIAGN